MDIKSAVVTGANGFIGKAVTKNLLDAGAEVWAVIYGNNTLTDLENEKLHLIHASFEDYMNLADRIESKNIDAFFHFAWAGYGAATNDYNIQLDNVKYTCMAMECAIQVGAKRFIFADSSHEHLKSTNSKGAIEVCSIYGASKHCAQVMCRVMAHNANIEFIGVMFVNIFGWGDPSARSTNSLIRKLQNGEDLKLVEADRIHNWTYIDDCVNGIIAAATYGVAGTVYYVGSAPRTFGEIMTDVRDVINPSAKLYFGVYQDPTAIDFSQFDINALHRDTGYVAKTDFKEAIVKTSEWLYLLDGRTENQNEKRG